MRLARLAAVTLILAAGAVATAPPASAAPADRTWSCTIPAGYTYDESQTSGMCPANPNGRNYFRLRIPVDRLWACLVPTGFTYGYSENSALCPPSAAGNNRVLLRVPVDRLMVCVVPEGFTYDYSETSTYCPPKVGGRNLVRLRVPVDDLGACVVPTGFTFDNSVNNGGCPPALNGRNFVYLRVPVDGLWACSVPAGFTHDSTGNSGNCPPAADGRNYFRLRGRPGPPTNLQAGAGNGGASLTWRRPASSPSGSITGYTVTASPGGMSTTVSGSATSATIGGLANGTAYTFTMTATNSYGTSVASAPSNSVTPLAPTPPAAPGNVVAVAGYVSATVSWSEPANNGSGITGYTVTSSPGGVSTTVSGSATSATVTGLTGGAAYTFTVRATNAAGAGPVSTPSNQVTALRPAGFDADAAFGTYTAAVTWSKGGNHWGDVNGDGRSDFVYLASGTADWHVLLSTGTSLGADMVWGSSASPIKWDTGDGPRLVDVDGDGRADVVYCEAGTGAVWHVLLSSGGGFAADAVWAVTTDGISSYGGLHQFFLVDADGDSRLDIVYLKDGTLTWRAVLSSIGSDQVFGTQAFAAEGSGGYHAHYWADMDNDHRADLVYLVSGIADWRVVISMGTSFGPDMVWGWSPSPIKWDTGDGPRLVDVDGDGRADVVYCEAGTGAVWHVLLSSGGGFAADAVWAVTTDGISSYGGLHQFFLVDADGDSRLDIVYLKDGTLTWRAVLSSGGPDQVYGIQSFPANGSGGYHAHYWADLNIDDRADLVYLKAGTSTVQAGLSR